MQSPTIVITGGSSGIGAAAARELRKQGATVAITGRSEATAKLAREIGADHFIADFAKFKDIRALASALMARYPRIDVLANNVGGIVNTHQMTEDGHEKTLQVNHLSGFLLTHLLRDRVSLVVNTSSGAHHMGRIDFDDMESRKSYGAWRAYGTAKLMNILHADEINRRYQGVKGVSFHPGVVATGFAREGSSMLRSFYSTIGRMFMLSPAKGADTLVWIANTKPAPGYYVKRKLASRSAYAQDQALARTLWDWSAAIV